MAWPLVKFETGVSPVSLLRFCHWPPTRDFPPVSDPCRSRIRPRDTRPGLPRSSGRESGDRTKFSHQPAESCRLHAWRPGPWSGRALAFGQSSRRMWNRINFRERSFRDVYNGENTCPAPRRDGISRANGINGTDVTKVINGPAPAPASKADTRFAKMPNFRFGTLTVEIAVPRLWERFWAGTAFENPPQNSAAASPTGLPPVCQYVPERLLVSWWCFEEFMGLNRPRLQRRNALSYRPRFCEPWNPRLVHFL